MTAMSPPVQSHARPVDLPTQARTTDVEAWRQRMEAKGAKIRAFSEREQTAYVSQLARPPKPKTAPAKGTGRARPTQHRPPQPESTGGNHLIRPCPDCGRPTRSGSTPLAVAPGTVVRAKGGRCTRCHRKAGKA